MNTFYHGDCLLVMNHDIEPESIDLIYLDPPFFTGKVQKGSWRPGEMPISYDDSKKFWGDSKKVTSMRTNAPEWIKYVAVGRPDFASYLFYIMQRLEACKRVLKATGSIYLHCDWRASHYLKMIMDGIFGVDNFRNEIVWCYTGPGSPGMRQFMRKHDVILYYASGNEWVFHPEKFPYKGGAPHSGGFGHTLDVDRYKELGGKLPEDWWSDIAIAVRSSKERVGYPTQKPIALLERIIKASSNEGDVVLDPFCGCGTAIVAAQLHGRQWVGIDISKDAYDVGKGRYNQLPLLQQSAYLKAQYVERTLDDVLAIDKPTGKDSFEEWVNTYYKARKPYPDAGIDGITRENIPIQTKTFEVNGSWVRNLYGDARLHPEVPKDCKHIILVSQVGFDDGARREAFKIHAQEGIVIDLLTPREILDSTKYSES